MGRARVLRAQIIPPEPGQPGSSQTPNHENPQISKHFLRRSNFVSYCHRFEKNTILYCFFGRKENILEKEIATLRSLPEFRLSDQSLGEPGREPPTPKPDGLLVG